MTIYIVEDNENAREALAGYLRLEEYDVSEFGAIAPAEREIARSRPDLLVLDVMLPDGDGFMFAKRLRSTTDVPIIFLTSRDQESDRITGLELGADDYVVKPFSPKEVVLRVKSILRRTVGTGRVEHSERYTLGQFSLELDRGAHRLTAGGAEVTLTPAEWNILTYLADKAPQVFSRLQLLESCLDSIAEGSERTIDTHVKNLRKKLGTDDWIQTVRGFGYRFSGESE